MSNLADVFEKAAVYIEALEAELSKRAEVVSAVPLDKKEESTTLSVRDRVVTEKLAQSPRRLVESVNTGSGKKQATKMSSDEAWKKFCDYAINGK